MTEKPLMWFLDCATVNPNAAAAVAIAVTFAAIGITAWSARHIIALLPDYPEPGGAYGLARGREHE